MTDPECAGAEAAALPPPGVESTRRASDDPAIGGGVPAQIDRSAADQPTGRWQPKAKQPVVVATIVGAGITALLIILYAWQLPPFGDHSVHTENAYVRGRTTNIAPQVNGYVVEVLAHDYQRVRRGQVLVRIDDRIYRARVDQARANLNAQLATLANSGQARAARGAAFQSQGAGIQSALAQLRKARADMARVDELVADGSVSRRERDQTQASLSLAEANVRQAEAATEIARQDIKTVDVGREGLAAQVDAARAQVRVAEIDLANTVIRAPEDGQLGEIGVRLGQYVTSGTLLLALVPEERWVIANFKETQTANIVIGQPAWISIDALDDLTLKGRVEQISPAAGSEFSVLKPDNATGNFVKVPQRIGVRIRIDAKQRFAERLRPGMSVAAKIATSAIAGADQ
jgi:multidrug resistance efflux pump